MSEFSVSADFKWHQSLLLKFPFGFSYGVGKRGVYLQPVVIWLLNTAWKPAPCRPTIHIPKQKPPYDMVFLLSWVKRLSMELFRGRRIVHVVLLNWGLVQTYKRMKWGWVEWTELLQAGCVCEFLSFCNMLLHGNRKKIGKWGGKFYVLFLLAVLIFH